MNIPIGICFLERDQPALSLEEFFAENDEFVIDRCCERFLMTLNPGGYLKRIKPGVTSSEHTAEVDKTE